MAVRVMRQVFHVCSNEMYGRSDERLQALRRVHSVGGMVERRRPKAVGGDDREGAWKTMTGYVQIRNDSKLS